MYEPCTTEFSEVSNTFYIKNVTPEDMKNIVIPEATERLVIKGDFLDELIIPQGVVTCVCPGLGIRKLVVPDGVEFLYCNRNNIRELELPESMYITDVSYNPMYFLRIRGEHPELGRIRMTNLKIKSFMAKVKDSCEIHMADNPNLIELSPEVQRAAWSNPFEDDEFTF